MAERPKIGLGFIESFSRTEISGWAAEELANRRLFLDINGEVVELYPRFADRIDLERNGIPGRGFTAFYDFKEGVNRFKIGFGDTEPVDFVLNVHTQAVLNVLHVAATEKKLDEDSLLALFQSVADNPMATAILANAMGLRNIPDKLRVDYILSMA